MKFTRRQWLPIGALAAVLVLGACQRGNQAPAGQQNQPYQPDQQGQANPNQQGPQPAPAPATVAPNVAQTPPAPDQRAGAPREYPRTPRRERPAPAGYSTGGAGNVEERAAPQPIENVSRTIPAGTEMKVEFIDGVSSRTNQVGDTFRAKVSDDISEGGSVVIPAGSVVTGTVTEAVPLKKIGGQARLGLQFSSVQLPSGRTATIHATFAQAGKSETKRDAATIGGAAAGGAVLGRVLSHDQANRNTVIGAVVGGALGTAIAAHNKGQEIDFPPGTVVAITIDQPTDVTIRR